MRVLFSQKAWHTLREDCEITQEMKGKQVYRITIENESRLEKRGSLRLTAPVIAALTISMTALFLLIAGFIIYLTPLRHLLPGYMREGERGATEESFLRLDSLNQAYERNELFLRNIREVLNTDRKPADSTNVSAPARRMANSDSLAEMSGPERKFLNYMRERERYSISIAAPLAAEGMIFNDVSPGNVVTEESRKSETAHIILPRGTPVASIADGTVIDLYPNLRDGGGYTMVIQHAKGFLSSYSRLTSPTVTSGTRVDAGETIALQTTGNGLRSSEIILRMWHDGTPLVPNEYLPSSSD